MLIHPVNHIYGWRKLMNAQNSQMPSNYHQTTENSQHNTLSGWTSLLHFYFRPCFLNFYLLFLPFNIKDSFHWVPSLIVARDKWVFFRQTNLYAILVMLAFWETQWKGEKSGLAVVPQPNRLSFQKTFQNRTTR